MRFKGIDSSELLMNLSDKGLAVSSGSACNSREIIPSHVLTGMGISSKNALCTIRISLSPENTWEELEKGAIILTDVIKDMHHD
jgi:cysteine desulfurase